MSLVDGQVLDGKYVITRQIAEGGMSTVFLGVNQRIGKQVAVKVLHPAIAREEEVVQRFEREARIVSQIRSPYVADVYDFGTLEDGARFMVMEYLEGESLAAMIERDRTIAARPLSTMALQILEGLAAAHSAGIVHRDLKPENVIVTKRRHHEREVVVKLVDFGISKVVEGAAPFIGTRDSIFAEAKATAAGAVLGTPLYMSPEQARGQTALVDQRTDLYSLGVMLYEATAGEPPLMGDNVNDLLFRVALDEPMPLQEKVPNVDPGFAAIVMKALVKDVTQRWQSAEEMKDALEAWREQFVSSSLSVVPTASTPPTLRSELATPMTIVTPTPMQRVAPAGIFARARRYAVAIPAAAMLILLIPAAKRALHQPEEAHPLIETTTAAATLAPEPALPEPVIVPAPPVEPVVIEPAKAQATASLPPPPKPRWTPPRKKAPPPVPDAGIVTETPTDPVAAATTVTAPQTETPNVIVLPSPEGTTPPDPQPTQEN